MQSRISGALLTPQIQSSIGKPITGQYIKRYFHPSTPQFVGGLNRKVRWTIDLRDKPYIKHEPSNKLSGRAREIEAKEYIKPEKFAIIQMSGRQFRVCEGDRIVCDRLFVDIGEKIVLNKVLMVGGPDYTLIGRPIIEPKVRVIATVQEQTRTQPIIVFKRKRRKRYQRWNTSRNLVTVLKIDKIEFSDPAVEKTFIQEKDESL